MVLKRISGRRWSCGVGVGLLLMCVGCSGSSPGTGTSAGDAAPTGSSKGDAEADAEVEPVEPDAVFSFSEVTAESGADWTYRNGEEAEESSILESLGGGAGLLDYDRDGQLDVFANGGGSLKDKTVGGLPSQLFRHVSPWKFEAVGGSAGIEGDDLYTHGVTVGDYDNDGFGDVLVTGYGGLRLWRNMGDGTFRESAAAAGMVDPLWSSSAGWGDVDGDGLLDAYVAHYVNWSFENHPRCEASHPGSIGTEVPRFRREICSPRRFEPLPDQLFLNNGDGTFRAAAEEVGLEKGGKGLGVMLCDLDHDGDLEVYVANDTTENYLYLNEGGKLREDAQLSGAAVDDTGVANGSMGLGVLDFNQDGRSDLFVSNYERESFALYRGDARGMFLHVSQPAGITALGGLFVGFGLVCEDLDRDGDEDIACVNGHVLKYADASPRRQQALLLRNRDGRFERVPLAPESFFEVPREARGAMTGDLDHDGDLDLLVTQVNAPLVLLRNDSVPQGDWLAVRLTGVGSNRDAVGARLTLRVAGRDLVRHVKGGGSYMSQSDLIAFWGIPQGSSIESLTVHWPGGATQQVDVPGLNRFLQIRESTDERR